MRVSSSCKLTEQPLTIPSPNKNGTNLSYTATSVNITPTDTLIFKASSSGSSVSGTVQMRTTVTFEDDTTQVYNGPTFTSANYSWTTDQISNTFAKLVVSTNVDFA